MARRGEVALQEHVVGAERGGGLSLCRGHGVGQLARVVHEAHPPAPSPGRGLDQERVADARTRGTQRIGGCPGRHHGAREHRDAGGGHDLLRPRLVAHDPHRLGRGAHPHDAGLGAGLRQRRALGEEAVARVQRVRARRLRRPDQRGRVQVRVGERRAGQPHGRVGLPDVRARRVVRGVDRDRVTAGVVRALDQAPRDLAPVGDEDAVDGARRRCHQWRTTPKTAVPCTGAECTAVSAMASTVRVSRGSMMPSSHSRPVAYCAVDSSSI